MLDQGYTYLQNDRDRLWYDEGLRRGWTLPEPSTPLWRRWGFRHARAFLIMWDAHMTFHFAEGRRDWGQFWHREWIAYAVQRGWV